MDDQKKLFMALALSLLVIVGYQFFVVKPRLDREQRLAQTQQATAPVATPAPLGGTNPAPGAPQPSSPATPPGQTRDQALAASPRIRIDTPRLTGSIALTGARIDDLQLKNYHETVDKGSAYITLLSPSGADKAYYAEFGWTSADRNLALPGDTTVWQADGEVLAPGQKITLTWDNGQGLVFRRVFDIDANFMFTVTDSVTNAAGAPVQLASYGLVSRSGTPTTAGLTALHEGPLGVLDGSLKELSYKKLKEEPQTFTSTGGWLGITDKYWLVALVPDQTAALTAHFNHASVGGGDRFQADYLRGVQTLAPGKSIETTAHLFAGAKEVGLIDRYAENLNIARFDRTIDWGWFYFLTRPMFYLLDFLYHLVGNFGIAILLLTVVVKAAFYPLANKSYISMTKMKALSPKMAELREKYKDDPAKLNGEMMEMYKREKVNPLAGCLPMVIQIPVFFSLYKVLLVTIEMRHAPFFGWVKDLSAPDTLLVTNLFGLIPYTPPQMIALGVWPLIMGFTMWLQQKLNPPAPDPMQQKIFQFMPLIFMFMMAHFAVGLVIYWSWNNLLSIAQQWSIMRRMGVKVDA